MLNKTITFDASLKPFILELLDKTVDSDGFVIEKNGKQRVVTIDGEELKVKKFAGMKKGSEIFFESDLPSLIKLADRIK